MILYQTTHGILVADEVGGPYKLIAELRWDDLFTSKHVKKRVLALAGSSEGHLETVRPQELLPPIGSQEIWAAGVTYLRSKTARMEESADAGASNFYDLIYNAHRPEIFYKGTAHRVAGHEQQLTLRHDSKWMVPEPELTLAFANDGGFIGYTIGNDMSSRDIEGENPLYLPQAKVWDKCAGLGPGLLLADQYPKPETRIAISIRRNNAEIFQGQTEIAKMKQPFENLREHLFRCNSFPMGCYLMTGTGVVPPDQFTLQSKDEITITIDGAGTLTNTVA
jgi:2-dehydro-3-deoxy-D-arabinonate dehydratase